LTLREDVRVSLFQLLRYAIIAATLGGVVALAVVGSGLWLWLLPLSAGALYALRKTTGVGEPASDPDAFDRAIRGQAITFGVLGIAALGATPLVATHVIHATNRGFVAACLAVTGIIGVGIWVNIAAFLKSGGGGLERAKSFGWAGVRGVFRR
jgi:NADH:ubiquinone oxidoreductase subunit 6 (subunit J)